MVSDIVGNVSFDDLTEKTFVEYLDILKRIMNDDERKELMFKLKNTNNEEEKIKISKRLTELVKGSVK